MRDLNERLLKLEQIVLSPDFLEMRGMANEVPYYIFDYPPQKELEVRDAAALLKEKVDKRPNNHLYIFDLYDIMMEFFEKKNFVRRFDQLEERRGFMMLCQQMQRSLRLTDETGNNYITTYIKEHVKLSSGYYPVIFLLGLGKCFPILRAHTILNFMHLAFSQAPVVVFFPGIYDGQYLRPFGTIASENYYRAFRIVP